LISLSPRANAQFEQLKDYYDINGYDLAYVRLLSSLDFVSNPQNFGRLTFYPAPRPAPALKTLGLRWTIHHRYWFAFTAVTPPTIVAIIDATSNIPRHASHLFTPDTQ
jgi:hypothetical protein